MNTRTMFSIDSFDWRSIAASHPATCVCGSCERARAETPPETPATRARDLVQAYGAELALEVARDRVADAYSSGNHWHYSAALADADAVRAFVRASVRARV